MADEKTYSEEDSTATSALQTDEKDEILSRQNKMAGPVDIADDRTHDRSSSNAGFTADFSVFANNVDGISNLVQNADRSSSFALNAGFGGNMSVGFQAGVSNPGLPGQQFPSYQNSPVQTVEDVLLSDGKRHRLPAAGQQLPAYQNIPVRNVEDRLFSVRIGLQLSDIVSSAAAAQVVEVILFL